MCYSNLLPSNCASMLKCLIYDIDTLFLLKDLWDCDKYFYPWPTPDLKAICRPFLIGDLQVAIEPSPVRKIVFIQVNQTYDETGISG